METLLRELIQEVIRKCRAEDKEAGKDWCLYTHDGKRLLGRPPSKEKAINQEKAVKAHGG